MCLLTLRVPSEGCEHRRPFIMLTFTLEERKAARDLLLDLPSGEFLASFERPPELGEAAEPLVVACMAPH